MTPTPPRRGVIDRLRVTNHRGVRVPAVLGLWLLGFGAASTLAVGAVDGLTGAGVVAAAGCLLVAIAGLVDDLAPPGPRGIRAHLAALVRRHVSTGIVKLVVLTAAAVWCVGVVPSRATLARLVGVVLVAGSANVVNGLDVRPGRALRFSLPVAAALVGVVAWDHHPAFPGIALGTLVLLPWDTGERAMLGDAGANLVGFALGLAAFHAVHGTALAAAAVGIVAVNVVAETVTLSRVIDALAPLRWYDRLGRVA